MIIQKTEDDDNDCEDHPPPQWNDTLVNDHLWLMWLLCEFAYKLVEYDSKSNLYYIN